MHIPPLAGARLRKPDAETGPARAPVEAAPPLLTDWLVWDEATIVLLLAGMCVGF